MDKPAAQIRPDIVAAIARWWRQSLHEAESRDDASFTPEPNEVAAQFHCSEEEALRGLTAGEQLYWGGIG
jgi:hypothetical protein